MKYNTFEYLRIGSLCHNHSLVWLAILGEKKPFSYIKKPDASRSLPLCALR